ncbi:FAD-dependent 5-carboxymethylaminomethyl-2-thiouridine(34) oxidoreductase MnmC [Francisellaceae bacterium CB300]
MYKIAIIGAGLAGCSIAYELSLHKDFEIEIFDKNSSIAAEASGNYAGILAPYLTSDNNFSDQFHTTGFRLLTEFIEKYQSKLEICNHGVVEILSAQKDLERYKRIFQRRDISNDLARMISSDEASELLGIKVSFPAVYYPNAISLVPKTLCELWLELSDVKLNLNTKLLDVAKTENNQWNLEFSIPKTNSVITDTDTGSLSLKNNNSFDIVIFAGSYGLFKQISSLKDIPVYPSHGQLTVVKNWADTQKTVIDRGYIIPNYKNNHQVIGATFRDNADTSGETRKEDDIFNLGQIKSTFSDLDIDNANIVSSRVATRCVTSDHIPIVGKLVDYEKFKNDFYKPLSKGYPKSKMPKAEYEDGLYLASGFGSKGLCSSLLSAKIITSQITNTKNIASDKLLEALSPQRFWIRSFKKGVKN